MNHQPLLKLLSLLVAMAATLCAGAQEAATPMRLSLDECLRIALSENPTIKVAEMEITKVDYAKKEARGQLMPELSFSGQYSRTLAKQTMYMDTEQGTAAFKVGRDNSYTTGFNATIPIVVPTLWKSLRLTDNQMLQNVEAARASRLSLVNQVKNAYYALLLAIDSKRVIEENHATAKLNADIFQKKYELGTASEYDALRAHVAVTNLEPSIIEAENSISRLKLQLKVLMGMDSEASIEPADSLSAYRGVMYEQALAADTSLVSNTSLKTLDLQTDYLRKALDVQKASWYPNLTGSANYMWNSTSNGNPLRNFRWSGFSSVGLTLSFTLFNGGQRYYKQRQAEVSLREMQWQRDNLTRTLRTQVRTQTDNLRKCIKQIETNEGGLRQAEKANDIMQRSFKIGSGTFIQLRDTEDALMNARLTYYQAIYGYLVAQSDLEYVLGNAPLGQYTTQTDNSLNK